MFITDTNCICSSPSSKVDHPHYSTNTMSVALTIQIVHKSMGYPRVTIKMNPIKGRGEESICITVPGVFFFWVFFLSVCFWVFRSFC
jgi:hypothetical protein